MTATLDLFIDIQPKIDHLRFLFSEFNKDIQDIINELRIIIEKGDFDLDHKREVLFKLEDLGYPVVLSFWQETGCSKA